MVAVEQCTGVPLPHLSSVGIGDQLGQVRGGHLYIRVIPTVEEFLRDTGAHDRHEDKNNHL